MALDRIAPNSDDVLYSVGKVPTDEKGIAIFSPLESGRYRAYGGWNEWNQEAVWVDASVPRTTVQLVMEAGISIGGRFVNERNEPLPDVEVWLRIAGPGRTWEGARRSSSADGSFRFDHVTPGDAEIIVLASHERYTGPIEHPVLYDGSGRADLGTIVFVERGTAVTGRLESATQGILAGAEVRMLEVHGELTRTIDEGETDPEGVFTLHLSKAGEYLFSAEPLCLEQGDVIVRLGEDLRPAEVDLGILLVVDPPHELKGKVLGPTGLPVEGAHVFFGPYATKSDAGGTFSLAACVPGPFDLRVSWTPTENPSNCLVETIPRVFAGEEEFVVELKARGLVLSIRSDTTGEALTPARITIAGVGPRRANFSNTYHAGQGPEYRLWDPLVSGAWEFFINAEGYKPVTVSSFVPEGLDSIEHRISVSLKPLP